MDPQLPFFLWLELFCILGVQYIMCLIFTQKKTAKKWTQHNGTPVIFFLWLELVCILGVLIFSLKTAKMDTT